MTGKRKRDAIEYDRAHKKKTVITPSNQGAASTYASSSGKLKGLGWLPTSFRVDAMDRLDRTFRVTQNDRQQSAAFVGPSSSSSSVSPIVANGSHALWPTVRSVLCPNQSDIDNFSEDMPLIGELMEMISRGETGIGGVNQTFNLSCSSLFTNIISNGTSTLSDHSLNVGLATERSQCDFIYAKERKLFGFIELKGGLQSPLEGMRQSAMYGTHFAIGLLNCGVHRKKVIVPSCMYNGMLMQFGATILLEPSFPVFWTTSKVLDMADNNEQRLALAYICKANSWVEQLISFVDQGPHRNFQMELCLTDYHIKVLTREVADRGFSLFSDWDTDDLSKGIEHMGRALNALFVKPEVRPHVVFPLAIRAPVDLNDNYIIIYEDLRKEGYRIGCPDRTEDSDLFVTFRLEFRRIMGLVHAAGVIHCDLYLSNVMWRKNEDNGNLVDIVIIDWDCAHCLTERKFCRKIEDALERHEPTCKAVFGATFDNKYINVLFKDFVEADKKLWTDLATNEKSIIDRAFYALFDQR